MADDKTDWVNPFLNSDNFSFDKPATERSKSNELTWEVNGEVQHMIVVPEDRQSSGAKKYSQTYRVYYGPPSVVDVASKTSEVRSGKDVFNDTSVAHENSWFKKEGLKSLFSMEFNKFYGIGVHFSQKMNFSNLQSTSPQNLTSLKSVVREIMPILVGSLYEFRDNEGLSLNVNEIPIVIFSNSNRDSEYEEQNYRKLVTESLFPDYTVVTSTLNEGGNLSLTLAPKPRS